LTGAEPASNLTTFSKRDKNLARAMSGFLRWRIEQLGQLNVGDYRGIQSPSGFC
jgi:hypothetical protein